MPEPDLEDLRRKIIDDLEQVELALKRQRADEEQHPRPVLRLLKGGLVGGAIWAGVEWFRDYKRVAAALVAAGITVTAAYVADQDDLPGASPPPTRPSITPTRAPRPTDRPSATPAPSTPPRTSPLRKLGTIAVEPADERTSAKRPDPVRTRTPGPTPTMVLTTTDLIPTPTVTIIPTVTVSPIAGPSCLGVATKLLKANLCLPLG